MVDISLKVVGTGAVLDWGPIAVELEDIEERIQQILPLLNRLLEGELARMSLAESELRERVRGIEAQNMVVEGAIWSATLQAELLTHIVTGQESIANHGFPEFDDE